MSHYRSEMGYESEDQKREDLRRRVREGTAEAIREAIKTLGVEYVLADIIADDLAWVKYRREAPANKPT